MCASDLRWLVLSSDRSFSKKGLVVVGLPSLNVNASPFSPTDIEGSKFWHQIPKRGVITVNFDYRQMGVGGDNSWGYGPHEEFLLRPKPYRVAFRIRPFSGPFAPYLSYDLPEGEE